MDFQIFIPPVLGGIIGYITNDIAIKMLFHPRKPIYIGKWRLPFTPGLIPKEKNRIAKSIGHVISTQLLNTDTLEEVFTSDEMLQKIRQGLEGFVDKNRNNENTIEETMLRFVSEESLKSFSENVKHSLSEMMHEKIINYNLGEKISKSVLSSIKDKLYKSSFGFMTNIFDDSLIDTIAINVGSLINKAIRDNSKVIIESLIDKEYDNLKNEKVCEAIAKYEDKIPQMIEYLLNAYKTLVIGNLSTILKSINIEKIVEDKIVSFDVVQFEKMIFDLMKKELRAIVYLGAILGFIMGWLNLLII